MKKTVLYSIAYFVTCLLIPFVITMAMYGTAKEKSDKEDKETAVAVTAQETTNKEVMVSVTEDIQIVSYLREEVIHILKKKYKDIYFEDGIKNAFQIVERDEDGNVIEIMVGNVIMSGNSFAELMNLNSANFTIAFDGMDIIFTVKKTN